MYRMFISETWTDLLAETACMCDLGGTEHFASKCLIERLCLSHQKELHIVICVCKSCNLKNWCVPMFSPYE